MTAIKPPVMPYVSIITSMLGDNVDSAKPHADITAPNIDTGRHPNLFTSAPANGAVDTPSTNHTFTNLSPYQSVALQKIHIYYTPSPLITQRRNVAKGVKCFQRHLFVFCVCLFLNTITPKRVNNAMKLEG